MKTNEKDLFNRILCGDTQAVEIFINTWHNSFIGFISKIVCREDAYDIAQEIYLKLLKRFHRFKNLEHAKRFLFKSGYRKALDYYRKSKVHHNAHTKIKQNFEENIKNQPNSYLINDLKTAIEKLSPKEKSVIILKIDYDFTAKEISAHLGLPTGTVLYRLHQAKKKIKKFFDSDKLCLINKNREVSS